MNLLERRAFYWSEVMQTDMSAQVQAARSGAREAWDALFARYQLPLFAYVRDLVRDREASLDIIQEAFIAAARHLDTLRDDAKFGSWLFGIARQKCVHHWRRTGRAGKVFDDEPLPDDAAGPDDESPGTWLIRREREQDFAAALERLPPAHREALTLHFLDEFPLEEIAAVTGVPLGTVKSRVHHAKKKLRELLEEKP